MWIGARERSRWMRGAGEGGGEEKGEEANERGGMKPRKRKLKEASGGMDCDKERRREIAGTGR